MPDKKKNRSLEDVPLPERERQRRIKKNPKDFYFRSPREKKFDRINYHRYKNTGMPGEYISPLEQNVDKMIGSLTPAGGYKNPESGRFSTTGPRVMDTRDVQAAATDSGWGKAAKEYKRTFEGIERGAGRAAENLRDYVKAAESENEARARIDKIAAQRAKKNQDKQKSEIKRSLMEKYDLEPSLFEKVVSWF